MHAASRSHQAGGTGQRCRWAGWCSSPMASISASHFRPRSPGWFACPRPPRRTAIQGKGAWFQHGRSRHKLRHERGICFAMPPCAAGRGPGTRHPAGFLGLRRLPVSVWPSLQVSTPAALRSLGPLPRPEQRLGVARARRCPLRAVPRSAGRRALLRAAARPPPRAPPGRSRHTQAIRRCWSRRSDPPADPFGHVHGHGVADRAVASAV